MDGTGSCPWLYGSDGRENKLLMGNKRVLCLTLGYGFLWYGMREMLSCLPALLLFTVSFGLLWECEEKECFLYAAGYLLGLEVTLWFAGRLPAYGVLTDRRMVWGELNGKSGLTIRHGEEIQKAVSGHTGNHGSGFFS